MKKILATILAMALGVTAWGADETPLVTVDVNGTITKYNSSDYVSETSAYNADGRCLDYVFAHVANGKTAADTVTITLNRDTTPDMNGFVVFGNAEDMPNVILDLNGHTISASVTAHDSNAQTVIETMYVRLTIRDSSVEKTGTITSTDAIFTVKAGAASYVTLESGNLLSTCVNGSLHGVGIVIQGDNPEGHILLEGGTFSGNSGSGTQWSRYVAEGKKVVDNGDDTFTVTWAVTPPTASIVVMSADQMEAASPGAKNLLSNIPVFGLYSSDNGYGITPQIGTSSASEAYIFQPSEGSTSTEIMNTYGGWLCDYVVSFDQGVDKSSVILAGHYGNMTMSFPIPKNFAGNNTDEMFLLDSVLPGVVTYDFIVGNVDTFICTALNVSKENIGKKITVSLVIWPQGGDKVNDRHVVTSIEYEFTPENLSKLAVETQFGTIDYLHVGSGYDPTAGLVMTAGGLDKQQSPGPHFSPDLSILADVRQTTAELEGATELASGIYVYPMWYSGDTLQSNFGSPVGTVNVSDVFVFSATEYGKAASQIYGNDWYCDYVVSFNQDVKAHSVVLAGYYASFGGSMSFTIPGDLSGGDKMYLLSSVGFNMDYDYIVNYVDTFVCTALNVSEENIGKKITVSLVMWPSSGNRDTDGIVVNSTEYTFTAENLTALMHDGVAYYHIGSGLDPLTGLAMENGSLVKQTAEGPHFSSDYTVETEEPAQDGSVTAEVTISGDYGDQNVVATVTVTADATTSVSNFSVENVVMEAAASLTETENTVVLNIKTTDTTPTATESRVYDVKPIAIVNDDVSHPITLSNADLSSNASFAFDLDVTGIASVGERVKVVHESEDYPTETFSAVAAAGGNGAVVRITTSHFSTFTVSKLDASSPEDIALLPCVTNSVASANWMGAVTVAAGSATNAFVAVPFGAFGVGDSQIAAADLVQAASLSENDKMYVWNGEAGKYDVYTVKNGAWTVAKKVTVAADGTQTEGSESPTERTVASGTGVFIERSDTSKPIYVYGQVLQSSSTGSVALGAGLTLISAPSTMAAQEIDLNTLTWSGVTEVEGYVFANGTSFIKDFGHADFIYYRDAENKPVRLYHFKQTNEWGTYDEKTHKWTRRGTIPAGTAFWYCNEGSAAVTWQSAAGE